MIFAFDRNGKSKAGDEGIKNKSPTGGESEHSWAPSSRCNAAVPRLSHKEDASIWECPSLRVVTEKVRVNDSVHMAESQATLDDVVPLLIGGHSVLQMATAALAEDSLESE